MNLSDHAGLFVQCPDCFRVVEDRDLVLDGIDEPAPCCGASGSARAIWPGAARHSLTYVRRLDLDDEEERRVAVVFLASAIEALFDEMLWNILHAANTRPVVASALMERANSARAKRELYASLVGRSPRDVLRQSSMAAWFDAWIATTEARNELAHGTWFSKKARIADLPLARDGALSAIMNLHNAAIDVLG